MHYLFFKHTLGKLPQVADGTELYDWAKFIAADTEEELEMIAQRNPQVGKAIVKLRELSADERARDMLERREKARRDIAAMMGDAINQGRAEGRAEGRTEGRAEERINFARKLLKRNSPIEDVIEYTGLTHEEIKALY